MTEADKQLVERLREDASIQRSAFTRTRNDKETGAKLADTAANRIEALLAENARMREALHIARGVMACSKARLNPAGINDAIAIARQALQENSREHD